MSTRLHRRFAPWVFHHALEFKWFYVGAFICLYVLQVLQSQLPERIRHLTILMKEGNLADASLWVFVGLAVGILIFRTCSRLLFFYPARVQQKLLRMEMLELFETVPQTRYQHHSQGQIFQVLFDDVNNLRAFIGFGLLQIFNITIAAWVLIPKLNQTDGYLWPAFLPLFASVFFFTIMTFVNQKFFKRMADKKGEVQQYIIESYQAKQTIKNFHREQSFISGFTKLSKEELSIFFKSSIGLAITGPYTKLGLGASLLWASLLIKQHGGSSSDLVFFSGFLYLFLEPVMFMSWVAVVISQGYAAWKRVKGIYGDLEKPSILEDELSKVALTTNETDLQMSLQFWQKDVLFKMLTGKWTVLIGETGSGKSYLLSKIATVMILKNKKVSMVQQEPYLFNDTIAENIFLGAEVTPALREKAKKLLRIFQLDSLEAGEDKVLELEVGENGKRLSGGQMKRVALVRSLMSDAPVLVWDDPFSSVDIILERKIIRALRDSPEWGNKTFIISSHRLTTVRLADEAIYVDQLNGIRTQGAVETILKEAHVGQFFKEQMVDLSLD